MTITEVSKKYNLTPDTLRYYERIGLIPPVPRNKSGARDYDEPSCEWVKMMKCMRKAGVHIDALVEYVSLFKKGDRTANERKNILIKQRELLVSRIEEMQGSLELLNMKIDKYELKNTEKNPISFD